MELLPPQEDGPPAGRSPPPPALVSPTKPSNVDPPRPVTAAATIVPKAIRDESVGGTGLLKKVGELTFSSAFDSANLKDVTRDADGEFRLWTACDCEGSQQQTRNASWFHFSVSGAKANTKIKLRIANMNRQGRRGLHRAAALPLLWTKPLQTYLARSTH